MLGTECRWDSLGGPDCIPAPHLYKRFREARNVRHDARLRRPLGSIALVGMIPLEMSGSDCYWTLVGMIYLLLVLCTGWYEFGFPGVGPLTVTMLLW